MKLEKNQLIHCSSKLDSLLAREMKSYNNSLSNKYSQFFQSSLPISWKNKALLADIVENRWIVYVRNTVDAFQFRYLAPEICTLINQKMNNPIEIKVKVNAQPWRNAKKELHVLKVKKPREYSKEEAQRIINNFLKQ